MIIVWIITAILLFSIIVIIHEFWHFKAARIFWVKVEEFWLWIPPRAKKLFTDKSWTLFSLNWLPIWGFVKLKWEATNSFLLFDKSWKKLTNSEIEEFIKNKKDLYDKSSEKVPELDVETISYKIKESYSKDNLLTKPYWQQAIIVLAWVFMNFILAFVLFSILFFIWVSPVWINNKIETNLDLKLIPNLEQALVIWLLEKKDWILLYPTEWSLAQKAWIEEGDLLLGVKTNMFDFKQINLPVEIIEIIKNNKEKDISLKIFNNSEGVEKIINLKVWKDWKIWSYLSENISINEDFKYKYWFFESIKYWALETYNQSLLTFKAIWILWRKLINPKDKEERKEALEQVSWPVWLVDFISGSISAWFIFLLIIAAIISINLWVFNLLPIPALDWWRFLFIVINSFVKGLFWRKAINEKAEMITNLLFFAFLIFLSIIITYNDILKIIEK